MSDNKPDKRKVSTDALETLGTIIGENEKRDAIHLAVEPARAVGTLYPGQAVGFLPGGFGLCSTPVGIVDPFLTSAVHEGQMFWLVVYPRKITSLRHVWEHPAFDDPKLRQAAIEAVEHEAVLAREAQEEKERVYDAKLWIENFADDMGVDSADLIEHATNFRKNGSYWTEGGRFEGENIPDEFWDHYEVITGDLKGSRGSFFSCSC